MINYDNLFIFMTIQRDGNDLPEELKNYYNGFRQNIFDKVDAVETRKQIKKKKGMAYYEQNIRGHAR